MKSIILKSIAMSLLLAGCSAGFASEDELDLDSKSRAKIAKAKIKQQAAQQLAGKEFSRGGLDNADCGSQNIGNVDTNGRPGSAPREVFVFAPNAINLVNGSGCR